MADLRTITKEELLAYFDRVIALNAPERKKLTVMVYSHLCERDPEAVLNAFAEMGIEDVGARQSAVRHAWLILCTFA